MRQSNDTNWFREVMNKYTNWFQKIVHSFDKKWWHRAQIDTKLFQKMMTQSNDTRKWYKVVLQSDETNSCHKGITLVDDTK